MLKQISWSVLISLLGLVPTAKADQVFTDDVIVSQTLLCVGTSCTNGEPEISGREGLKINAQNTGIVFEDTSTSSGFATTDWAIDANQSGFNGADALIVKQAGTSSELFRVNRAAGDSALVVDRRGIGIRTNMPDKSVHVIELFQPTVRLEQEPSAFPARTWDIAGNNLSFFVEDQTLGNRIFQIFSGAPGNALVVDPNGAIGVGTTQPEGVLHTRGTGVQIALVESADDGAVQLRLRSNSENRRFLAVDKNNIVKSQIIFKDNEILFTGQTDSGANRWLTIGPAGIVSQGPTCGSPCDLTFDPDVFEVPPIAERAAYMWEHMHLPAIGPTSPDEPINLTEKTGGIIHELEVAHIYIEQLHSHIARLETDKSEQNARLSQLEAQMQRLLAAE